MVYNSPVLTHFQNFLILIICQARLLKISVNVSLTVFQNSPTEEFLLKLRNLLQDLLIQNVTRERKLTSNLEEKSIFYVPLVIVVSIGVAVIVAVNFFAEIIEDVFAEDAIDADTNGPPEDISLESPRSVSSFPISFSSSSDFSEDSQTFS